MVFQGSAKIPLLFIIYLDGVMVDLAALNIRSKLSMRIRPNEQNKKILRGEIKRGRTIRRSPGNAHNQQFHNKQAAAKGHEMARSQKSRQRALSEAYRRRQEEDQEEEQRSKEGNMEQEITGTEMPHRNNMKGKSDGRNWTEEQ